MNIQEIPFQPLTDWLQAQLEVDFPITVKFDQFWAGRYWPRIDYDGNLLPKTGIFINGISCVYVDFSNAKILNNEFSATISIYYSPYDGKTTELPIAVVMYSPENGWKFDASKKG